MEFYKMANSISKRYFLMSISFFASSVLFAQKDTAKSQSVNITSVYKPTLREPSKIKFSGSQLPADTAKILQPYNVPAQNLFYSYQPIPLRPLALQADTAMYLGDRNFVKAGFGNLSTPFLRAGVSLGDGKTSLVNITGDYIGSKGKDVEYQDYKSFGAKLAASFFLPKVEVYGAAGFRKNDFSLYGYDHNLYPNLTKSDIKQNFTDVAVTAGLKNKTVNKLGINYNPNVELSLFKLAGDGNEKAVNFQLPVQKIINEKLIADVVFNANISKFSTNGLIPGDLDQSNKLVTVSPSIIYHDENIKFNAGATPAWDNGKYTLLPNLHAEVRLADQVFAMQAGWVGKYVKNSYRNLTAINPYLARVLFQENTKEIEYYGGVTASFAKHFNLNAKAGLVRYENLPLFVNNPVGNKFLIFNESKIKNFRVHGDLSYNGGDNFLFTAAATLNAFTGLKDNKKAYQTIPVELRADMKWQPMPKLSVKAGAWLFSGSKYLLPGGGDNSTKGGTDISVGGEYKINKQFSVWLDANNLLNNKYERWNNYQVYGVNVLGGIVVHF